MSATLRFQGVSRVYETPQRTVEALRAIDLHIEREETVGLVGPSGCGKSTLLNIASGVDHSHTGSFTTEPGNPTIGFMFQSPRLLDWRTVRKNVALPLEARGLAPADVDERVRAELEKVGLLDVIDSFPGQLSGGMQQRVALARALALRPDLLLMDEPFSALDELTALRLRRELVKLVAQESITVIFVTHDVAEACFLADRVVVMGTGPGRVIDDLAVEVPQPRDYEDDRLVKVRKKIFQQIESTQE